MNPARRDTLASGAASGSTFSPATVNAGDYRPRAAEHTVLYRVIDEHLDTFLVAPDRLRLREDGRIVLTLKTAWADGTRQLVFEPLQLLEKLAALTPRPRIGALPRRTGATFQLASPSGGLWRAAGADARGRQHNTRDEQRAADDAGPRHWAWADLMRRAFDIDVLACPRCGGRLRLIATVADPDAIRAILLAVSGLHELAGRAPPDAPTVKRIYAAALRG